MVCARKAYRDLSKLTKKVMIDKNGHKKTVYMNEKRAVGQQF